MKTQENNQINKNKIIKNIDFFKKKGKSTLTKVNKSKFSFNSIKNKNVIKTERGKKKSKKIINGLTESLTAFVKSIINNKKKNNLFVKSPQKINKKTKSLFKTTLKNKNIMKNYNKNNYFSHKLSDNCNKYIKNNKKINSYNKILLSPKLNKNIKLKNDFNQNNLNVIGLYSNEIINKKIKKSNNKSKKFNLSMYKTLKTNND